MSNETSDTEVVINGQKGKKTSKFIIFAVALLVLLISVITPLVFILNRPKVTTPTVVIEAQLTATPEGNGNQEGVSGKRPDEEGSGIGKKRGLMTQDEFYTSVQIAKKKREEELKYVFELVEKLRAELKGANLELGDGKDVTYSELFQLAKLLEPIKDEVNPKFEVQVLAKFMEYCEGYNIYWYDEGTLGKYLFLFRRDAIQMEKHNVNSGRTYTMGYHTRLAEDVAVTEQEMKKVDYDGLDLSNYGTFKHTPLIFEDDQEQKDGKRPTFDLREGGYVSKIDADRLNKCESPWFLAAAAMYDSFIARKKAKRFHHSAQQIWDCADELKDSNLAKSLEYFLKNPLCLEASYPFTGSKGQCQGERCRGGPLVRKIVKISEERADEHLKTNGAFMVIFDAPADLRTNYTGGIYDKDLGTKQNSVALVVGYGTDPKTKKTYWIAQPAWKTSSSWGEDGYFRISSKGKYDPSIFDNAYGLSATTSKPQDPKVSQGSGEPQESS
ncbi:Papain cysteine protease family protein [Theileria equi strain WA]|uniref:Papain cysteine protease family protein n=1 Tax=Theileria equi strain WA TaxID=1537102 RepID=L1L9N9_THEEQ|nr:Papain cysteine protease family protein [Theileria equi strain WA]EKX72216.1 Papain cysteine protease family protein [Theileria equi strain WA]|eukprot:XP_004831668.1 Papain cysteine protease family protein [Theileria equi strain WA]